MITIFFETLVPRTVHIKQGQVIQEILQKQVMQQIYPTGNCEAKPPGRLACVMDHLGILEKITIATSMPSRKLIELLLTQGEHNYDTCLAHGNLDARIHEATGVFP